MNIASILDGENVLQINLLTAFISPYRADRERVRGMVEHGDFIGIYCDSPISVCESRDVKGLYKTSQGRVSMGSQTAHAKAEGRVLITNNEREFKRVAGLKIENWAKS